MGFKIKTDLVYLRWAKAMLISKKPILLYWALTMIAIIYEKPFV